MLLAEKRKKTIKVKTVLFWRLNEVSDGTALTQFCGVD